MAFVKSLRRGVSLYPYVRIYIRASMPSSVTLRPVSAQSQWRRVTSGAGSSELEVAAQRVTQLSKDPGNEAKLKLYALYKQATIGPCNKNKPGMFDLVGRAKWDAWNQLGTMDKSEAAQQYCATVEELVVADQSP